MSKYLELVEGSFTQEHFNKQKNQKPYVAYSIKDGNVIYTIIPNEEEEKYTIYRAINYVDISNLEYKEVDLGVAGVWADRNVGAKNPEHYGSYFQWGDPTPYTYVGEMTTQELVNLLNLLGLTDVTTDNVKDILASEGVVGNDLTEVISYIPELNREFNFDNGNYFDIIKTADGGSAFNKYYDNGGLTVLESIDDAATVHMGSKWKMPTIDDIKNLINNTTQTAVDIQGKEYSIEEAKTGIIPVYNFKGVRFTSSNGNSIFLPAAGIYQNINDNLPTYALQYFGSAYLSSEFGLLQFQNDSTEVVGQRFYIKISVDQSINAETGLTSPVNFISIRCLGLSVRGVKA